MYCKKTVSLGALDSYTKVGKVGIFGRFRAIFFRAYATLEYTRVRVPSTQPQNASCLPYLTLPFFTLLYFTSYSPSYTSSSILNLSLVH